MFISALILPNVELFSYYSKGQFVMLHTKDGSKLYVAEVLGQVSGLGHFELKWYNGNIYNKGEEPEEGFFELSIQSVVDAHDEAYSLQQVSICLSRTKIILNNY